MSSDLVAYSEIPAVADSESHGPNMETVVGEDGFRPFRENGRRPGTTLSPTDSDSPFQDSQDSPRRRSKSVTCIR